MGDAYGSDDAVARLQAELAQDAGEGHTEGPSIHERALAMVQALLPYARAGRVTADFREARRHTVAAAERLLSEAAERGL